MTVWADAVAWMASVPPWVWVCAMVGNIVVTALTWSTARRRARRAGQRAADPDLVSKGRAKDTALTLASLIPAGLFWLMVLGGSFHGLVAFGQSTLGWQGGWEYLVPGTLDGVSVTFAMLAFRAVKRGKTPDRCYRVIWGAALASATINFAHEFGKSGNALAGGYVALLSLFGMFMFDEFLNQFEDGADSVQRENPKFGVRWLTWPSNTFLAAVAWRNHPPAEGTPGTVANAVANLNRVRAKKNSTLTPGRPTSVEPQHTTEGTAMASEGRPHGGLAIATPRPQRPRRSGPTPPRTDGQEDKVPATSSAVARWARTWMQMCEDPEAAWASMQDEELARDRFNSSSRHLRYVRYAAGSGALRRRSQELNVDLPTGFDERLGDSIASP